MQTKELTFGALAPGDNTVTAPLVLRNLFGARIRFVSGYPGGNEINLAMERGEVDGRCGWSWSSIKTTVSDWLRDKRIHLLVQMALQKSRELPDVPLVMDMASNNRQRQILRLILSEQQMAWPVTAPPDLPPDHARALRAAFDATMQDPEFRAELARRRLDINPMSAAEIVQLISELYQTPEEVVAAAKAATSEGAR
jgi:LmbE family N-acetylglucosaminyl deacetylase